MDSTSSTNDFLTSTVGQQGNLTGETSTEAPPNDQTSETEEQESGIPAEQADSTSSAESTGEQPQKGKAGRPRNVTQDDIRKLQSGYDKQLASMKAQLEAANNALMQSAVQAAQVENMVFESSIQQLPADQQQMARAQFQARQQANIANAQREAEKANMKRTMELLAPLARERVALEIAQEHGVDPKELIGSEAETPAEMTRLAKVIAKYEGKEGKTQRTQARQERKQDVFEGAGIGAAVSPDLKKQYAGTGNLADYFRAQNATRRRK